MNKINKVELIPATDLSTDQAVDDAAHAILSSHTGLPASRLLRARGLQHFQGEEGIYDRGFFSYQPNGLKTVFADRQAMAEGERATYLLRTDANTDRDPFMGVASIDPSATVRTERVGGKLGRMLSGFTFLSEDVATEGPRIHAWIGDMYPYDDPTDQYETLRDAYAQLREEGGQKSWTVEPQSAPEVVHQAIRDAGLSAVGEGMYNDFRSNRPLMPGILYLA